MKISEIPYKRLSLDEIKLRFDETNLLFDNAKNSDEQLSAYEKFIGVMKNFATCESLAYVRFTLNTEDKFYDDEREYYDQTSPIVQEFYTNFTVKMLNSPFCEDLKKVLSPLLFLNYEINKKSFDSCIIEDIQEENRLTSEYTKLLASAQIPFNGETLNIPQLGKYKESNDREVRKAAFNAHGHFMAENCLGFDEIFDKLVKVRDKMAKKMGYKNFVELGYYRMGRNCYEPTDIAKFREQVLNDWLPVVRKLKEKQAKILGIDKIMLYDDTICLKNGNPEPIGDVEQIFANGKKMYSEMSPDTKKFIEMMLEHDLFDVLAKKGKTGGGYCTSLPDYKFPFIFANFNGTYGDIDVLTHEAGHAFADFVSGEIENYELRTPGMETAEIHSMSMEFFAWKYMELFFGEKADEYRYMHLCNSVSFIPYGIMVDYFQQLVYEKPDMTPIERKDLWKNLEGKFRPYMSSEGIEYIENGGRWQYQSHIYERPFYYIDYCLAQTVSLFFFAQMQEDYEKSFENYLDLVKKGGTKTFVELVREAGFVLPFENGALKNAAESVEGFLNSMKTDGI